MQLWIQSFLMVYGLLSITHLLIQIFRSEKNYINTNKNRKHNDLKEYINVSVILPIYNEKKEIVTKVINSILRQKKVNLELIIIDDKSDNRPELFENVYSCYDHNSFVNILYPKNNIGKRHCQKLGFDIASGDYIVTIDSDTILKDELSIYRLSKGFIKDKMIGGITGNVEVENKSLNLLTKLISYRYWMAFNQEREAQSLSGVVMCCSGPFSIYKKNIIDKIKHKYITQRFLGVNCTYGDDRHLTNLILAEGYKTIYDNTATAYTYVPENIKTYIKQQIRWNKSFYREMLWTFKFSLEKPFYLLYDLLMQLLLPVMLLFAILILFFQFFLTMNFSILINYFIILVLVALVRIIYSIYRTKDVGFLTFIIYGFIHISILLPVRIYAICNLKDNKWGTR